MAVTHGMHACGDDGGEDLDVQLVWVQGCVACMRVMADSTSILCCVALMLLDMHGRHACAMSADVAGPSVPLSIYKEADAGCE